MAKTPSTMLPLGTPAPDFKLPSIDRKTVERALFQGRPLLVMFLCNHCPYVKHIHSFLLNSVPLLQKQGIAVVGISSNDPISHPEDSFENMQLEGKNYSFPYLFDDSQEVAKAYQAACTPDFFLFDASHLLVYRGQLDESRPGNKTPVSGKDLYLAVEALLAGQPVASEQKPSMGCNIKWKSGNEPKYFSY